MKVAWPRSTYAYRFADHVGLLPMFSGICISPSGPVWVHARAGPGARRFQAAAAPHFPIQGDRPEGTPPYSPGYLFEGPLPARQAKRVHGPGACPALAPAVALPVPLCLHVPLAPPPALRPSSARPCA